MRGIASMVMALLSSRALADPSPANSGATAEIAIGGGIIDSNQSRTAVSAAGGVGGWVHPRIALSVRLSLFAYRQDYEYEQNALKAIIVLAPHAQLWATRFLYVGLGGGLLTTSSNSTVGFETRLGFALPSRCAHSWSVVGSLIGTPERFPAGGVVLLSYQHL